MEEDTLSLSELPLARSDSSWKEYSTRDAPSTSSFNDDDDDDGLFEFFSGDFAAGSTYPADHIIFCGKDIANNKEAKMDRKTHSEEEEEFKTTMKALKSSISINKVGSTSGTSSINQQAIRSQRILASQNHGLSSTLAAHEKPRRYLFEFGIGRHLMGMERRPLKTRHSQKGPGTTMMFRSVENGEVIKGKVRRPRKGSWGLLKLAGCLDRSADRVVKASFVCMPEM